ncbi:hypothetical protein B0H67DRAFT_486440 [Lasiosphaeris hirsuta]|uniref:Collagen-like protein n=1 Tax=Lasiosphaeris hirsuta TaxID=260670 RepID=A0AA40DZP9_9PEZI|nr:hypothetical protein B0H67DRAFT_486440 [Lasiosphaeris hirsuta]
MSLGLLFAAPLALAASATPPSGYDFKSLASILDYEDQVCHPVTEHASDTVPPCLEIVTIETMCTPNGTTPLDLKAHQDCMCRGSFFDEWPFCLQCLFLHGLRSQRDVAYYKSVLATASRALCSAPAPTAEFAGIFGSAQAAVPYPTTGATVSSDAAPSSTAVSLYFTATRGQGPGQITGDAASATASVLFTAPKVSFTPSASGTAPGVDVGGGPAVASGSAASGTGAKTGVAARERVGANSLGLVVLGVVGAVLV